ncbi:U11/U12 small nuclear ribonucleoprotein 25 kDa protein-like [Curcuma longa]|uniref:U11/U12 small nuclear ribonucleoprotein 25 kDa protein-like n=1 Tax=Curcuma longa TaxID=136217 RepID=UPI003D9F7BA2
MESSSKAEEDVGYSSITTKKAQLQSMLSTLLDDPILADVSKKPTLVDVDTLINLELGSAMKITIVKMDNTSFDVAVLNSATVKDLKLAIKKKINEMEQTTMGHRHISWRHVWANFCLSHQNEKLVDDNSVLSEYGVTNNSKVHFFPLSHPGRPRNILREGNTVSFMVSVKGYSSTTSSYYLQGEVSDTVFFFMVFCSFSYR